jgi:hypothetical protein
LCVSPHQAHAVHDLPLPPPTSRTPPPKAPLMRMAPKSEHSRSSTTAKPIPRIHWT